MLPLRRLWNAARRSRLDADLREELSTHMSLLEEEEQARGRTAGEARRLARARFGSATSYRERALDAVVATSVEQTCKELLFAGRRLLRSPAFTIASTLTLGLAIAANVAIFTVVHRVVLNPLPYPDSDRLIELVHGAHRLNLASGVGMTRGLYYQYSGRARTLEAVAVYAWDDLTLTGNGDPERLRVARVTPSLASVLRVRPATGRWFTDEDGAPGAARAALLSHALWARRYRGDLRILGRTVMLGGDPTQVIGVMPPSFAFPDPRIDMWIAERMAPSTGFGIFTYHGVARLRDQVSVADARVDINSLIADLPRAYPGDALASGNGPGIQLFSVARSLKEAIVGDVERGLWVLLAAVGLLLLVACTNVANLFLVRGEARRREIAVRRALGAGRLGIARYFLAESALLSIAGGAIGLALARVGVDALAASGPATLPRLGEIRMDGASAAYAVALSALVACVFGSVPLWQRGSLAARVHEIGRANTTSRARRRAREVMMGAQVAIALVLLIACGLMVRSFQNLRAVDPGFDPHGALALSVGLPERDYPTRAAAAVAHQAVLDRLSALPGVESVAASTCLPLAGPCSGNTVLVKGRVIAPGTIPPVAYFRAVTGGYFEAMHIRVLQGRGLTRTDVERREPVVVVNEAFVRRFLPQQPAVGEYIASNRPPAADGTNAVPIWLAIAGVVANTPTATLADGAAVPQLYMPMSIAGGPDFPVPALIGPSISVMSYVVRSTASVTNLLPSVRRAVGAVDPGLAVAEVRTLQDMLDRASAHMAFTMALLVTAAGVALALGLVGIYGLISYVVTQRTGEIGVRLALGAAPSAVATMILRRGAVVALAGSVVGLATALAAGRLLESLLYGISSHDAGVFAVTTIGLLAVSLLACWLPARRAARLDPLQALRAE